MSPHPAAGAPVIITVCPNGPLLVRGDAVLADVDGATVGHDRNVIALCRCGRSTTKPLCDGSHRLARFRDDSRAPEITRALALGGDPTGREQTRARPGDAASCPT